MARKTVEVEHIKEKLNYDLSGEGCDLVEAFVNEKISNGYSPAMAVRLVLATILEGVLFRTDNYKGFSYKDGDFGNTDPTKRVYY